MGNTQSGGLGTDVLMTSDPPSDIELKNVLEIDDYNVAVQYFNSRQGQHYTQRRLYIDLYDYNQVIQEGIQQDEIELDSEGFYPLMFEVISRSVNVAQALYDVYRQKNQELLLTQAVGPIIDYFYEDEDLNRAMWLHRHGFIVTPTYFMNAVIQEQFQSVLWYLNTIRPDSQTVYDALEDVNNNDMYQLLNSYVDEGNMMHGGKRKTITKRRSKKKKTSKKKTSKKTSRKRKSTKKVSKKKTSGKRKTSKKNNDPIVYKNMTLKDLQKRFKQIDKRPKTYEKTENGTYPISWNIGSDLKENEIYTTDLNIFFHKNGESVTSSYTKPSYTLKKSEIRKIVRKIVKEEQKNKNIKKINKVATHFKPFLYRGKPEKGAMIADISIYHS